MTNELAAVFNAFIGHSKKWWLAGVMLPVEPVKSRLLHY
jgi:hypothetical protein